MSLTPKLKTTRKMTEQEKADEVPVIDMDFGYMVTPIEDPKGVKKLDNIPKEMRTTHLARKAN